MKINITKYTIVAAFVLIGFGCNDLLDEDYRSGNPTNTFYASANGLEALVVGAYVSNKIWYGHEEGFDFGDVGTDMYTFAQQHPNPEQFTFSPSFNSNSGRLIVLWVEFYKGINACNEAIFHLLDETHPLSAVIRKKRLAEMHFLRAFYYWHLVYTFGDVPMPLEHTTAPLVEANRTPVNEVYSQILEDVNFAVDNFTDGDNAPESDFGRISKDAALAFRARLSLNIGSFIDSGNEFNFSGTANEYYQQAKADADALIPKYSFYGDYNDLWALGNNSSSKNLEGIWAINYSRGNYADLNVDTELYQQYFLQGQKPWDSRDGGHHGHLMWGMFYEGFKGMKRDLQYGRRFRRYMPNKYLPDAYNEDLDARFAGQFRLSWMANDTVAGNYSKWDDFTLPAGFTSPGGPVFGFGQTSIVVTKDDIDDTRIAKSKVGNQSLYVDGPYYILDYDLLYNDDGTINDLGTNGRVFFLELSKFDDAERLAANGDGSERGARDAYVFRLAEMYLIAAEADWKLNNGGYSYLQTLADSRTVDGTTGAQLLTAYGINSAADLNMEFFLDERAREFPGEQMRWMDLRRVYNRADWVTRINKYNEDTRANLDVHHYVRPIPQVQIDAVQNDFPQNKGY